MKAIITKYLPATNMKPARIKATAEGGNSVTISYPQDDISQEAAYRKAAEALCAKMNWPGQLFGGGTENGYVFVFGPDWKGCVSASNRLADLVCAIYHPRDQKARQAWPTATWAEIIAAELGVNVPVVKP